MTNQEAFDKMVAHLTTQNRKAVATAGDVTTCMLLAPDGAKCAVGCLIPDGEYAPNLEDFSLEQLNDQVPSLIGLDYDLLYA